MIQPVDDHDISMLVSEVGAIQRLATVDFHLIAVKADNWNHDLSPWKAPAVFGDDEFGDGAKETLTEILNLCQSKSRRYYLGGYSLAGLFSLWGAFQTDAFAGIAAASPSLWFPGFLGYMKKNSIQSNKVYLSLGDKEEKTKNPVMSQVGGCIRECHTLLVGQGINCTLEWNKGGHFNEPELRTAKAFAWVLNT